MDLGSVVNQGLVGMQNSQASMLQSARQIAQVGTTSAPPVSQGGAPTAPQPGQAGAPVAGATQPAQPAQDLAEPLVNLRVQSQVFDANARVIQTANDTLGALLDVRA